MNLGGVITMKLKDYIEANFVSLASFARSENVKPQQITEWINKGFTVHDGELKSTRRKLKEVK